MGRGRSDEMSRRLFLRGAAGVALFSTSSCDRIEDLLGMGPKEGPCVPPTGEGIDLVSHVINRVSFGPTPSDYHRVKEMGATEEEAAKAYLDEQLAPDEIKDKRAQRAARRFEALSAPLGEMYEYKEEFLL